MKKLTARQQRFVVEFLKDGNATQAAIRAGFSKKTAKQIGSRLLTSVDVRAAVDAGNAEVRKEVVEHTGVSIAAVLDEFWGIATADVNELVEYRRHCCRYCYGDRYLYQLTAREDAERRAEFAARKKPKATDVYATLGGIGYDPRKDANPKCPDCFGDGVGEAFFKDTRNLSPAARRLYAGVRITKEGLEVKMHDKGGSLQNVGRHLGMFLDRVQVDDLDKLNEAELEALALGKVPLRLVKPA